MTSLLYKKELERICKMVCDEIFFPPEALRLQCKAAFQSSSVLFFVSGTDRKGQAVSI